MKLLTEDNDVFLMETLPKDSPLKVKPGGDGYVYYCIIDVGGEPENYDFDWQCLYFWEEYDASGLCMEIGKYNTKGEWETVYTLLMPMDWSIMIKGGDPGTVEVISLKEINDRDFEVPVFNPLTTSFNIFEDGLSVRVSHTFKSVSWTFPQLSRGQLLAIPLEKKHNPPCVFMALETGAIPKLGVDNPGFYLSDLW